jgi:hypothetical protein
VERYRAAVSDGDTGGSSLREAPIGLLRVRERAEEESQGICYSIISKVEIRGDVRRGNSNPGWVGGENDGTAAYRWERRVQGLLSSANSAPLVRSSYRPNLDRAWQTSSTPSPLLDRIYLGWVRGTILLDQNF